MTTKRILLEEFKRGFDMCWQVQNEIAPWSKVYEPHPFLDEYKNFLLLEILARAEDVYKKFSGWPRVRHARGNVLLRCCRRPCWVELRLECPGHAFYGGPQQLVVQGRSRRAVQAASAKSDQVETPRIHHEPPGGPVEDANLTKRLKV